MIEIDLDLPLATGALFVRASLPPGLTAVMGPSGSGKTSLLESVAGLRPRARGRVVVDGVELLRLAPETRRIGYVPQDAGLFPHLSVLGNVRFGARGDHALVESALEALEIRPLGPRRPASLSGGEKQRVALARALASAPRLLLLDEPLAALDVGLKERILPYLRRIRNEWKVPILYVTHNVGEALALGSHVLLLRRGQVEAQGAPSALLASTGLGQAETGIENLLAGCVAANDREGGVTRVQLDHGPPVVVALARDKPVGERVTLAVRAEDILVAVDRPHGLSARNVYEARLLSVERTDGDVLLQCEVAGGGTAWLVRVTPAAVAALELRPHRTVWLALKSHSVRMV